MAILPTLLGMKEDGIPTGYLIADSGYPQKIGWTLRANQLGYKLVIDYHPADRGRKGTWEGAIGCDGCPYCPAIPPDLLTIAKPGPTTPPEEAERIRGLVRERRHYRFQPRGSADSDGYRRVTCPGDAGKVRCPLKKASMQLKHDKPPILHPPQTPPTCCLQQSITIPPTMAAKTRQAHYYLTPKWNDIYAQRPAVERVWAYGKDAAGLNMNRGFVRVFGRAMTKLLRTFGWVARNLRILDAHRRRLAHTPRATPANPSEAPQSDVRQSTPQPGPHHPTRHRSTPTRGQFNAPANALATLTGAPTPPLTAH